MPDTSLSIFISYARADVPFVDGLETDLRQQGFDTWVDRRGLSGGQHWRRELQAAIDRSTIMLVVLSPDAVASENVQIEYGYAIDKRKVVIPLYYRKCEVPMELRSIQWIDFQQSYEQGIWALVQALRRHEHKQKSESKKQEHPPIKAYLLGPSGPIELSGEFTIGRKPDNNLVVTDRLASGYHVRILPLENGYSITDMGSANKTIINEKEWLSGGMSRMLKPGDVIRIGATQFTYQEVDEAVVSQAKTILDPQGKAGTIAEPPVPSRVSPQGPNNNAQSASGSAYGGNRPPEASLTPPPAAVHLEAPSSPPKSQKKGRHRLPVLLGAATLLLILLVVVLLIVNPWQSTPSKVLDAFCSDIQNKDYQGAYNLITVDYQARLAEPSFKTYFSSVTSCAHSGVTTSNGDILSTIMLAPDAIYPWNYQLTMVKDSSGNWKIDNFLSAPDLMLTSLCSDIQSKNYLDAYNLLASSIQARFSESQFTKAFSPATSCTTSPVAVSNSITSSTLTLGPDTSYPWTYQLTLAKDSSGNWKIDQFSSAPDLTLGTFCNDIQSKDYQDAYNLLSLRDQSILSEPTFQNILSSAISCQHELATESNNTTTSTITFGPSSFYLWGYQIALSKDSSGTWKIDGFNALPDLTLNAYCSDIGSGNLTDAYSLTSSGFQSTISKLTFDSDRAGITSCTHTFVTNSNGSVTSTITYNWSNGTTTQVTATLIKNSNGDWKIDSFS